MSNLNLEITNGSAKFEQLAIHLRELIDTNILRPGDTLPTFAELRAQFGVSQATYDRAQSMLEKDGLIDRRRRSGTFVRHRMQGSKARIIGVAGSGFHGSPRHPYFDALLDGMREAARRERSQLLLIEHFDDADSMDQVTGLILMHRDIAHLADSAGRQIPAVSVLSQIPAMTCIAADEYAGIREAVRHLLSLGHTRIAYLKTAWAEVAARRVAAYYGTLIEAGIQPDPRWCRDLTHLKAGNAAFYGLGSESMAAWLEEDWVQLGCTAILAQNDDTALGVIDALHQHGLSVPGDVSVVGFDDTFQEQRGIALTSVAIPLNKIGGVAVQQVLRMAAHRSEEISDMAITLPATLQIRGTTAAINPKP